MSRVTSVDHPKVVDFSDQAAVLRTVRFLQRRSVRDAHGLCWVEGPRACLAAERNAWTAKAYVYCRRLSTTPAVREMLKRIGNGDFPILSVDANTYRSLSRTTRASGIGVVLNQRWTPLRDLVVRTGQTVLVVERIRSVGNLGTIVRTAEATGAAALVLVGPDVDPFDPQLVRSSMGGVFGVPLVRASVSKLQRWLTARNVRCTALSPEGKSVWQQPDDDRPTAILVGEERRGLSENLRSLTDDVVSLPMTGEADSLNVAVATGVMLYELARRRQSSQSRGSSLNPATTSEGRV